MEKYIIFGTGKVAQEQYEKLMQKYREDVVEYFLDSMLSKENFCGKKVIHPDGLANMENRNEYIYVLGTYTNKQSMIGELKRQGVLEERILKERDYGSNSFEENIKNVRNIYLYPPVSDIEKLKWLDQQFHYLVPNMKSAEKKAFVGWNGELKDWIETENLQRIESRMKAEADDLILIWNKAWLEAEELIECSNIYCIDPQYFILIDIRILLRLNKVLCKKSQKKIYESTSISNYKRMQSQLPSEEAYIIGMGPSCKQDIVKGIPSSSLRIVCNGMILLPEILHTISPQVYVIAEETYADCGYENSLGRICEYVLKHGCYLVMPDIVGHAVLGRHPEIMNNIVLVTTDAETVSFLSPDSLRVYRKAYNVITTFAVPLASGLCEKNYFIGCDGTDYSRKQKKDPESVWEYAEGYNPREDFQKEVLTILTMEEKEKIEYYKKHCIFMEEIFTYGEARGRKYASLTHSYIPALEKRLIREGNLIIIQARMDSSRLPHKVLKEICGKPMLEHVIERVERSRRTENVLVATTKKRKDDAIEDLCKKKGIICYRGSENDVLDRYYQAASLYRPQNVVRITADCPLADAEVIDEILGIHEAGNYDYTSNTLVETYPDGLDVEVFTWKALEEAWEKADLKSEREHVTPYIKFKGDFKRHSVERTPSLADKRWTVDTEQDFDKILQIYEALYSQNSDFYMQDVLDFLNAHEEIEKLNEGIIRNEGYLKSLAEDSVVRGEDEDGSVTGTL